MRHAPILRPHVFLAALFASALWPAASHAQYFGRNKVQYDRFDFRVLHSEHFDLHYYPAESAAARDAARMAERWYARLAGVFGHEILTRQTVVLYADHADFQQSNVISEMLDESTGGVTEGLQRRVMLPLSSSYAESDHVLGHELVHAFQYDVAAKSRGGMSGMNQIPPWMIEGMAEYLSLGRDDPHTAMWLRDAVLREDIPSLRKLTTDYRYFPYRFGEAVWAYIGGRFGDRKVTELYRVALETRWEAAVQRVLGVSADSLSAQWARTVENAYRPLLAGRSAPDSVGRTLVHAKSSASEMMLAPAISPDGRFVAFLWAREFSLDLYLADARTGEIVRRLANGAAESKFDALSFMGSAGAWSPDGTRFAFVVFAAGANEIAILDISSGDVTRRFRVENVGAIASPAWSPDGTTLAFSGSSGGLSDLYLLDANSGAATRITNDAYADLQPAWSPDGRSIAFVTDRSSCDLQQLTYGPARIALLDVATHRIRTLDLPMPGRHTNPQFSPDGQQLFFLADGDGFRDLYRARVETGELHRVTHLATGITGLTAMAPAMTVAANSGDLAFAVFDRRGYQVRVLPAADASAAAPVAAGAIVDTRAGSLPPSAARDYVERYLDDALTGLPETASITDLDYTPRPRLSYFGAPAFGVGVDQFGVGLYASVQMYFTDVLGDHGFAVQALANGGWKDLGGQLYYENLERRLNWGVGGGRTPYVSRYAGARDTVVTVDGRRRSAQSILEYRERLYLDEAFLAARYPLSSTRRIEATGGLMRVGYDYEVGRAVQVGNNVIERETTDLAAPADLMLWQSSAAFVDDHSVFGIASPVQGGRFRFEIQPTIGSLRFYGLTADLRNYFYRRPFTLATRLFHYGRYGEDADRAELGMLFVGSETLVRGYSYSSFTTSDCGNAASNGPTGCAQLDRLIGSRLAVANLELRVPLFGNERIGLIPFRFLPTELTAFIDGGMAWTGSESPSLGSIGDLTARSPVFSAGVGARFNLFGALVLETYYAHPFQRTTGNRVGVQLAVGW